MPNSVQFLVGPLASRPAGTAVPRNTFYAATDSSVLVVSCSDGTNWFEAAAADVLVAHLAGTEAITGAKTFSGGVTVTTAGVTVTDVNVALSATTGTKLGTATTQKLGFWNATPVVQPLGTDDIATLLATLGLRASGATPPATLGATTTTTLGATAITATSLAATAAVTSSGATSGVGYATGAGGAVTQGTNRTTGVTLNTVAGAITLISAAGSATPASFTVTNSAVAATDVVHVTQKSGTDLYEIFVTNTAAGSFKITSFTTGGTTTEQPVFNFAVVKAVAA